jgi:hypothetical protein
MLKKQIFLVMFCGIEIVILMVVAKVLFFSQVAYPLKPNQLLQTQSIQNRDNTQISSDETQNVFSKWEYKTLIVIYQLNSSKSPLGDQANTPSCPSVNMFDLAHSSSLPPCIVEDSDSDLVSLLNVLGNDGWELVSVTTSNFYEFIYVFKRAK